MSSRNTVSVKTFEMSSRRPQADQTNEVAQRLRSELESLKTQSQQVEVAASLADSSTTTITPEAHAAFDQMSGAEQAAGSLGVHPEAWKPIKFMNNMHFDNLIKSNVLDDTLTRRIEAFRSVAASS